MRHVAVGEAGKPAWGASPSLGGYWDVNAVADDLAEFESLGKLARARRSIVRAPARYRIRGSRTCAGRPI